MRIKGLFVVFVLFVGILILSLASASWFSGLFGKPQLSPSIPAVGNLDIIRDNQISGWAYDSDKGSQPIMVYIWATAPNGVYEFLRGTRASDSLTESPSDSRATGHSFSLTIPSRLRIDGTKFEVSAIDYDEAGGIVSIFSLNNSPQYYNSGSQSQLASNITTSVCVSNWTCANWTECVNQTQTRLCADLNNCTNITTRPSVNQSCTPVVPTPVETPPVIPSCVSNWICTNWICQNGIQVRNCSNSGSCSFNTTEYDQVTHGNNCACSSMPGRYIVNEIWKDNQESGTSWCWIGMGYVSDINECGQLGGGAIVKDGKAASRNLSQWAAQFGNISLPSSKFMCLKSYGKLPSKMSHKDSIDWCQKKANEVLGTNVSYSPSVNVKNYFFCRSSFFRGWFCPTKDYFFTTLNVKYVSDGHEGQLKTEQPRGYYISFRNETIQSCQ